MKVLLFCMPAGTTFLQLLQQPHLQQLRTTSFLLLAVLTITHV
jgi:hypothetical protein